MGWFARHDPNSLVCPWWLSSTLTNGLRRSFHDPVAILSPYVRPGSIAADIGCGPGYFTVPLASLVSPGGRVIAVDLQERMLERARRAAERAGCADAIDFRRSADGSLGITERLDFALAFWMAHEVPDQERFLGAIAAVLAPQGRLLVVEPKIHVSAKKFERLLAAAARAGLVAERPVAVPLSRGVLLTGAAAPH